MTKQEQIDAYRAKISEMQKKIRELKVDGIVETDKARIAPKQSYAYRHEEEWQLAYAVPLQGWHTKPAVQYRTLYAGSRQECIEAIPQVIHELTMLYQAANGVD